MKVILLQDIENIGKKYEVKEVKEGYARNFLLPKNLVKTANKQNLKWLEQEKKIMAEKAEDDLKRAQETASKLDGMELNILIKVGEEGQLFESVNSQKIAEKLQSVGFEIKKNQIVLQNPIKEAGEFPVKINLDHNLETEITVVVSAEK